MAKRIITTENLEEDSKIEGQLRPQLLSEYIGQEKAKKTLSIYIEAAKARGEALDHVLFYGPPGLGKTTLAGIIANEMGVNMKITSGPAIEKPGEMAAILNGLQEHDVLFVDEIHRLNRQVEKCFTRHGRLCDRHYDRKGTGSKVCTSESSQIYTGWGNNKSRNAYSTAQRPFWCSASFGVI